MNTKESNEAFLLALGAVYNRNAQASGDSYGFPKGAYPFIANKPLNPNANKVSTRKCPYATPSS